MKAGKMDKHITLQVKTIGFDADRNPETTWNNWRTVWAEALPQTGREFYRLQTMNSEITTVFRIRYNRNVTPHMRVLFGSRALDIIDVINVDEAGEEMLLTCKGAV